MSAQHLPYIKWFPTDWRADPRLRMCSLAARGLWIELIGYMHEGEPYGHLTINGLSPAMNDTAALVGRPLAEVRKAMAELEARQVYSVDEHGRMYSRRMVRDKAKAEKDKTNGADGGNPEIRRGTVAKEDRVRPYRRSDSPQKTMRIFQRDGGKCHWCRVDLIFNPDGIQPNGFHVDHVLPICDGGTNDDENLVASCASCNHKRARNVNPTATPDSVGIVSDVKAHIPEAREPQRKQDAADAAPSGRYAFESGVIRLNQRDFDQWTQAFSYLELRAELLSLSKWAATEGANWFHAVKGALAKRNREVKARAARPETTGDFKWNGTEGVI